MSQPGPVSPGLRRSPGYQGHRDRDSIPALKAQVPKDDYYVGVVVFRQRSPSNFQAFFIYIYIYKGKVPNEEKIPKNPREPVPHAIGGVQSTGLSGLSRSGDSGWIPG